MSLAILAITLLSLQYLRYAIPPLVPILLPLTSATVPFVSCSGTPSKALQRQEDIGRVHLRQRTTMTAPVPVSAGTGARSPTSVGDIATWQLPADATP